MAEEDINAVVEWINCFELSKQCESFQELFDGRILCEFLNQVAPSYFDTEKMTEVEAGGNWALMLSNLKKLVWNLQNYFQEALESVSDFDSIDLTLIARDQDIAQLMSLIELVVGAAVKCEDRAFFIGKIMELPDESQAVLKGLIESSMERITPIGEEENESDEDAPVSRMENRELEEALAQSNTEKAMLHEQLKALRLELSNLQSDKESLSQRLEEAEKETELAAGARQTEAQGADVERTQLQKSVDELSLQLDDMREENNQLRQEVDSLAAKRESDLEVRAKMEVENRQLADELDIARSKAHQAAAAEQQAERYKRRLDEMQGLRQAMKELEDQNSKYLDQVLELESTCKTIKPLNDKIEKYKDAAIDLEREKFEALSKLQVREAEFSRLREELEQASDAKRFFEEELIALREEKESMEASTIEGGGLFEGMTEMREKLAKLERENRSLKENLVGGGEGGKGGGEIAVELSMLRSELEDEKRMKEERAAAALEAKRLQAEAQMECQKLKEHIAELESGETRADTAKIQKLTQEIEALKSKQDSASSTEMTVQELTKKLKEKETQINRLTSDKDKLETYTKKTLHKVQEKYLVALQTCKNQLKERQDKIEQLESRIAKDKASQKREERLLMSAVYELGMDIINTRLVNSVSEGLKSSGGNQSGPWLRQKREEVTRKINPISTG
mmetsp:Transcript_13161/g.17342  ORF Transcript_13161/g.17342 Transcript_13161/m.17342 type:complete len:684 (+) Transcript_13161:193-2244(+)